MDRKQINVRNVYDSYLYQKIVEKTLYRNCRNKYIANDRLLLIDKRINISDIEFK